jgi:lysozyme
LTLIKQFEGWVPRPYNDPANYCTIGYGRLIALRPCSADDFSRYPRELTLADGEKILEEDTRGARLAVQQLVTVDLSDNQFGALASFVFNVGRANFETSTLRRLLNGREYALAAQEFPRWVRAKNVVHRGLVNRRACEASLFLGALNLTEAGIIDPDRSCRGLGAAASVGPLIDIEKGEQP